MFQFYFDRRFFDPDFISPWAFRPFPVEKKSEKGVVRRVRKQLKKRKAIRQEIERLDLKGEAEKTERLINDLSELKQEMLPELEQLKDYSQQLYYHWKKRVEDEEDLLILMLMM